MVDNGLGLTMLPEMALDAGILNGTNVVARPLKSDNANREIALVWRKNSPRARRIQVAGGGAAGGLAQNLPPLRRTNHMDEDRWKS